MSLPWFEEYVTTMEAMGFFAQGPWDAPRTQMRRKFFAPHFQSLLQIETGIVEVRNKYLLAALYKAGLSIAGPNRGQHNLNVWIYLGNYEVGKLQYQLKGVEGDAANSTYLLMDSNLTKITSTSPSEQISDPAVASTGDLSAPRSGWVSDPNDQRLRIHYEFQGRQLSPTNVFTTFLDAMVTAAQSDGNEPGARLTAFSVNRQVSMRVWSILLTWTDLKKALMVLWQYVVVNYANPSLMRWEDLDFTIYEGDTFLGQGDITMSAPAAPTVAEAR